MKALITGANGFIGTHLAAALTRSGHQSRCLVRSVTRSGRLAPLNVEIVTGDVCDLESLRRAVQGVDVVFHLAGLIKGLSLPDLLCVNEEGTRNVAQACAEQPAPPTLLLVSSLAAAGPSLDGQPRVETDPARPISNYGRSKRAGELAAAEFADRLPLTIVRPPVVFGGGDAAMVPVFRPILWARLHLVPGFRLRRASMLHVDDLVPGLIAAAERGERVPAGDADLGRGIYYFASERDPSLGEWGELIARSLGRRGVTVLHLPEAVGWCVAGGSDAVARLRRQAHIFSLDKMRELTAGSWVCSAERARAHLGFSIGADFESRVAQTTAWYLNEGWI